MLAMRAAERAAQWHAKETHKDAGQPFINHLIEVASLVAAATKGRDPALTAAAFLHDAIEKGGIAAERIREEFGAEVCDLVVEVTDDRSMNTQERRRHQIDTASQKSLKAKMIKLADKTSNLRALARAGPGEAEKQDPRDYADWAEQVAAGLRGVNAWLEAQFDAALATVRQQFGPGR